MKKLKKLMEKIVRKFFGTSNDYNKFCKSPIEENMILLEAGQGKNINGNMFAILRELNTNEKWKHMEPVFVVTDANEEKAKSRFEFYNLNARTVVRNTKEYCRILAVAKYLITDNSFPPYFYKREGQVYMNTWHGTPLKTLGKSDIKNALSLANIQKNYLMSDYALFPNTFTRDVFMKDYMLENLYTGKVVLCDYPRNSIFLEQDFAKNLRKKLNLEDKKLIAYLPTWRGTSRKADVAAQKEIMHEYFLQIDELLREDQIFYVNLHFLLGNEMDFEDYEHIRPFPPEYETYHFLTICDMLVTDYSSVFFDFASTGKKIILFPYDLEDYMRDRGTYFPITDLPFPITYSVEELIREINLQEPTEKYTEFLEEYCGYRDLHAPEKVLELMVYQNDRNIVTEDAPNNGKELKLVYVGELVTRIQNQKILEYIQKLETQKTNVLLCFRSAMKPNVVETLKQMPEDVNYMALISKIDLKVWDRVKAILSMRSRWLARRMDEGLRLAFLRERKRMFYHIEPSKVIYYAGNPNYICKILGTFHCEKEAFIQSDIFYGNVVSKKKFHVMKDYFQRKYDVVHDLHDEDVSRYFLPENLDGYYNSCFQISNVFKRFSNKNNKVSIRALALIKTAMQWDLKKLKIKIGEELYDVHISNVIKLGRSCFLCCYSLKVPIENMKILDIQNKINFVYQDECNRGLKKGIRYSAFNFSKGKGKSGPICIFKEENTSAYFKQSNCNYLYLTVRERNLTDYRRAQIRLFWAYYAARIMSKKNILLLYEKNSSRYEESASVLYEKLLDQGYKNAYFIIDRSYEHLDEIPEKYRSNLVYKGTFRHYLYFFMAKTFIGSEMRAHAIDLRVQNKYAIKRLADKNINYVFLQHGVMYMVSLDSESRRFFKPDKLNGIYRVVTSSEKEAEHFIKLGRYKPEFMYVCGLPKFDKNCLDSDADKIVIMPTWRSWEYNDVRFDFESSKYYQMICRIFESIPEEYHEKIVILPHPLFFDFVKDVDFGLKKYFDSNTKYDEILRKTRVLITDYSSIAYDAFYRGSNVIFYWEEKDECLKEYGASAKLMLNEENVFGDICYCSEDLQRVFLKNYHQPQEKQFVERYREIVEFHDGKNTERLIELMKQDSLI
ncbi:MAG: CDP-glycerol glycerophosphotransferase family protein [Lachnospiraceae bacterium]|nr:CDP-glycerol glycerophosphotransferase family protein [Lachnospiraceae bacterium]